MPVKNFLPPSHSSVNLITDLDYRPNLSSVALYLFVLWLVSQTRGLLEKDYSVISQMETQPESFSCLPQDAADH